MENNKETEMVKVPVVELFDEGGEKVVFELLETIEHEGDKYMLLTQYYETEEEYDLDEPADVFVMKEIMANGEAMLETVEDDNLLQTVYGKFKANHEGEFEFRDNQL